MTRWSKMVAAMRAGCIGFAALVLTLWIALPGGAAMAHSLNQSYVYFNVTDESLSGRIEVREQDLVRVFAPDAGRLNQAQIKALQDTLFDHFDPRLQLSSEAGRLSVDFRDISFLETDFGTFAQLNFDVSGLDATPETIEMGYAFIFPDIDPDHRGFALIESNSRTGIANNESRISLVFGPGDGTKTLWLSAEPAANIAQAFVQEGVWHVLRGVDHLFVLVALLLGAVMVIRSGRWGPAETMGAGLRNMLFLVTVFVVANTATQALATFGGFRIPVRLVDAAIVLSVIVLAAGHLVPRLYLPPWIVVGVLGLVHGFALANVLAPLGLDPLRKAIGLATFNIGVELGQIAVVLVLFPVLFVLRDMAIYRPLILRGGSVALVAVAGLWFVERAFDVLGPVRANLTAMLG